MSKLAIIIAAAGSSTRLGQPKQLVKLNDTTLLHYIAQIACQLSPSCSCVVGYKAQNTSIQLTKLPIKCLYNPNWQHGMGTSIAHGVRNLAKDIEAVLILLCDQWRLTRCDLSQLIKRWHKNPEKIVASLHHQMKQPIVGVPAIFPKQYFTQLAQLKACGARKLILQNRAELVTVRLPNAQFDLDTPEDLNFLEQYFNQ